MQRGYISVSSIQRPCPQNIVQHLSGRKHGNRSGECWARSSAWRESPRNVSRGRGDWHDGACVVLVVWCCIHRHASVAVRNVGRAAWVANSAGLAPAPFAGMILQDFGADVVRVDRPNYPNTDCLHRYVGALDT